MRVFNLLLTFLSSSLPAFSPSFFHPFLLIPSFPALFRSILPFSLLSFLPYFLEGRKRKRSLLCPFLPSFLLPIFLSSFLLSSFPYSFLTSFCPSLFPSWKWGRKEGKKRKRILPSFFPFPSRPSRKWGRKGGKNDPSFLFSFYLPWLIPSFIPSPCSFPFPFLPYSFSGRKER